MKISTVVQADELDGFYGRYADVCKMGMTTGMKKRDRTKRKKEKAKKKKGKTGTVMGTSVGGDGEKKG